MIKKLGVENQKLILNFIKHDNLRNYFIRLSLEKSFDSFIKIYGEFDQTEELLSLLFLRKSGNLQFYAKDYFNESEVSEIIETLEFNKLISSSSVCDKLNHNLFRKTEEGALLSELTNIKIFRDVYEKDKDKYHNIIKLEIKDLNQVVEIYKKIFDGFSNIETMAKKLESKRGRGYYISEGNKIVSVVQTEFENENSAIIVAVGTDPEYERKGFATILLKYLCKELIDEGKNVYLQYDNPHAGRLYEKIGFVSFDRINHYYKT